MSTDSQEGINSNTLERTPLGDCIRERNWRSRKWIFPFFFTAFKSSKFFQHIEHWEDLKANVLNTDLIVDKLIFKDVQLTATNDDQYFVFEDIIYQVVKESENYRIVNKSVIS